MITDGEDLTTQPTTTEAEADAAAADVAAVAAEQVSGQEPGSAAADAGRGDPLHQLALEAAKWRELALRTAADLDNFRKRVAREREDAMKFANQALLEELLPVLDNFEMGMQAAASDPGSMIYIGMEMVRKQFADLLAAQGVSEVPADPGAPFDPLVHEAMLQEESATVPEGRLLRIMRRGFRLRERLLRPASVVVAKAPAPAPASLQ
jgi:molecular chaperone GrpE